MAVRLSDLTDAVRRSAESVSIDWQRVDTALKAKNETDLETAYASLAREWLEMLREEWQGDFKLYESANFLVLSARPERLSTSLLRLGERTYAQLTDALPTLVKKSGFGKFVCIVADSIDRYYDYVDSLSGNSSLPISAGVYLPASGYAHFLLNHNEPWDQETTFVHELTHALLHDLPIPIWMEEGITQVMEENILGISYFQMNREEFERHSAYWSAHGLTEFWYGSSFNRSDEGQELSYALSQVLVRHMLSRDREQFIRFVEKAASLDCGESASREVYGLSLANWAGAFLGEGDWEVRVETAEQFYARAHARLQSGDVENAKLDLDRTVELRPQDPHILNDLAWLLATHPEESLRDGDAAVQLALSGCEMTDFKDEPLLDTLAAAYAEAGDFPKAIEFAKRAIKLAPDDVVAEEEKRLSLYERGVPYREAME